MKSDKRESKIEVPAFLRWIGGKSKIIRILAEYAPENYERYSEPFLGGASMFFFLKPHSAILSDSNRHLINCYKAVKNHPVDLSRKLEKYRIKHSKEFYYKIRSEYNAGSNPIDQSARFIYLNKTSFNGIYRVNMNGEFNVPYGNKEHPNIPTKEVLLAASTVLKTAKLRNENFDSILTNEKFSKTDFIYLDPPYPPLNGTSNFTHYTQERFLLEDQKRLSEIANTLNKRKCKVMITNADTPLIRQLYKNWKIISLPVMRWVSANGKRYNVNELVIINYEIKER